MRIVRALVLSLGLGAAAAAQEAEPPVVVVGIDAETRAALEVRVGSRYHGFHERVLERAGARGVGFAFGLHPGAANLWTRGQRRSFFAALSASPTPVVVGVHPPAARSEGSNANPSAVRDDPGIGEGHLRVLRPRPLAGPDGRELDADALAARIEEALRDPTSSPAAYRAEPTGAAFPPRFRGYRPLFEELAVRTGVLEPGQGRP